MAQYGSISPMEESKSANDEPRRLYVRDHANSLSKTTQLFLFALFIVVITASVSIGMMKVTEARDSTLYSVNYSNELHEFQISNGVNDLSSALVYGKYLLDVENNGWNFLSIHSNPELIHSREDYLLSMEAMGYLEGYATCHDMEDWYQNFYAGLFEGGNPKTESLKFLEENYDWTDRESSLKYADSEYWLAVRGVVKQVNGLYAGYRAGCQGSVRHSKGSKKSKEKPIPMEELSILRDKPALLHVLLANANGDLFQIEAKYKAEDLRKAKHGSVNNTIEFDDDEEIEDIIKQVIDLGRVGRRGKRVVKQPDHCSALIKLLPDNADVLFSHTTWDDFQCAAPRIYKHYSMPVMLLNGSVYGTIPTDIYFSSSPGLLSSVDDFFLVQGPDSHLSVIETSLDVFDYHVLEKIQPHSVLSWIRSRVSNQLAVSGSDWTRVFSMHHSGTYTNQWMIIDMNKFDSFKQPKPGFFTVLEEIPGYVHWEDMTQHLVDEGYWASYNLPYFKDISDISGNSEVCRQDPTNCYDSDPRSQIFKKYQHTVKDVVSMQAMIGYNDFQKDPESMNNSCNTIACREDIEPAPQDRYPFGAIDAKVSSVLLSKEHKRKKQSSHHVAVPDTQAPNSRSLRELWGSNKIPSSIVAAAEAAEQQFPLAYVLMGPPTGHHQIPFCWSEFAAEDANASLYPGARRDRIFSHHGHPKCFDYEWQTMPPPMHLLP